VHWGEETFLDGVSLDAPTFYRWLQEREAFPTTSQPSPGAFIEFFREVAQKYETKNILGIFISSELSGTLASAIQAKAELPDFNIELVDSRSTSMGLGLQALVAVRAAREGQPLDVAVDRVQHVRDNMQLIFAVDTLEYLHRGGRIGGAARLLGTALNLKPVLHLVDGKVMPLEKVRKRRKSLERVVELVKERVDGRRVVEAAVVHAQAGEDADLMEGWVKENFAPEIVYNTVLTPVVGTHAGPGTIGVALYVAE